MSGGVPDSAPRQQVRGFRLLDQAEHPHVELSRDLFVASRHGQLDVRQPEDLSHG